MPKNDPLWECSLRTKAKLEILNHYLGAWFGILAANRFTHVFYIDGFCGPGKYLTGEEGSPVIAARLASDTAQRYNNFKATLIFIDKNTKVIEHLKNLDAIKKQHPNITIDIIEGDFADKISNILETLRHNRKSPTFSFIDPFGFSHTPLDKIKELMHNDSSEIFVNLWCGPMNRFKDHPDDEITLNIKNMVGDDNLDEIRNSDDCIDAICSAFENNLKNIGQYTRKFEIRNERNARVNALVFCGKNSKGFEKIKEAMWKIDREHGKTFSAFEERKRNIQPVLFSGPDTNALFSMILEKFGGQQKVSVKEIFRWVIDKTETFLPTHARVELDRLVDRGFITSIGDTKNPTRKRRKGQWPPHLILNFGDSE